MYNVVNLKDKCVEKVFKLTTTFSIKDIRYMKELSKLNDKELMSLYKEYESKESSANNMQQGLKIL